MDHARQGSAEKYGTGLSHVRRGIEILVHGLCISVAHHGAFMNALRIRMGLGRNPDVVQSDVV